MNTRANAGAWVGISVLGLALAAGCASTTGMSSTWTDPAAKGSPLAKVAVVCMVADPAMRQMAENTTASQLTGAQAIPSYQLLGDTNIQDREAIKARLSEAGVDGVLVMRVVSITERVNAVPYQTFDGYYDYAGASVYNPSSMPSDTIVHVVSNLYSIERNKLIWSGISQSFDPASAKAFMTGVSKAVAKSLQKDRLIL